jgi:hypothetical protein
MRDSVSNVRSEPRLRCAPRVTVTLTSLAGENSEERAAGLRRTLSGPIAPEAGGGRQRPSARISL